MIHDSSSHSYALNTDRSQEQSTPEKKSRASQNQ
jgi:hypothetical protein